MPDDLLDAERIRQYVAEVAVELPDGGQPLTIVLVGGAFMAWHDLRASTRDVDSASRLDAALVEAVERVRGAPWPGATVAERRRCWVPAGDTQRRRL